MIKITEEQIDYLALDIEGKITEEDYNNIIPALDAKLNATAGNLNAMIQVNGFEGIEFSALGEGLMADHKHNDRFDRVAIVGDGNLEKIATQLARPIFGGEVRHFDSAQLVTARQWLRGNEVKTTRV